MEGFLSRAELVLPVLGFDFLKPKPVVRQGGENSTNDASPIFEYTRGEAFARAQEVDGEFVVLKGSTAFQPFMLLMTFSHGEDICDTAARSAITQNSFQTAFFWDNDQRIFLRLPPRSPDVGPARPFRPRNTLVATLLTTSVFTRLTQDTHRVSKSTLNSTVRRGTFGSSRESVSKSQIG